MPGFLGIDHPLITVRDVAVMRDRYAAIGFRMTPVTQHPWGTATTIAVFPGCLLELMGVADETLIDRHPAGDFRFGRTVRDQLAQREGITLLALNSDDADGDARIVQARGIVCQGGIEFGRDIVLPDGRPDRTATSLRILYDPALPLLSNFICQQHRRDLIEVPAWLAHPNGATGIAQVTVAAARADWPLVRRRMQGLYGAEAVVDTPEGFAVQTGNGRFLVCEPAAAAALYAPLPPALAREARPFCLGVHVRVPALDAVRPFLRDVAVRQDGARLVLTDAASLGNVFLAFEAA